MQPSSKEILFKTPTVRNINSPSKSLPNHNSYAIGPSQQTTNHSTTEMTHSQVISSLQWDPKKGCLMTEIKTKAAWHL